ncbi:MAG: aminomethyl transferase family protein [Phycisphaerae bacterium]|nr:aminomethyl transferase family protein [Phycisphaerae bacterium]
MPRISPLTKLHESFVIAENERRAGSVAGAARRTADSAAGAASDRARIEAVATASNRADVEWIPFGPDDAPGDGPVCRIVAGYGTPEAEYAAIRRSAGVRDAGERGVLRLRGRDRAAFLQRMLTQDLAPLAKAACVESFWLNRKGRIDADLLLVETGAETLVDLDVHAAVPTRESLDRFLFGEEAAIEHATESISRLSLHGPRAAEALEGAGLAAISRLSPGGAAVDSGGAAVAAERSGDAAIGIVGARRDQCGVPGFELFVPIDRVESLWSELVAAAARPIGWDAYNIARIEGGTPLFRVDFGTDSLPHETGVLDSRVSFRKGCYLGQEIVARMHSLGAPKQVVVRFRAAGARLPVAGAPLSRPGEELASPVGVVTSSTISPLLGGAAIGFATVRSAVSDAGRRLVVHAQGEPVEIEVLGPPASFLSAAGA